MSRLHKWLRALDGYWFAGTDPLPLRAFRVLFTLSFLWYFAAWWTHAPEWLTSDGFHLSAANENSFYPAPFPPLSREVLPWFGLLTYSAGLLLVVGSWPRTMAVIMAVVAIEITFVDRYSAFTVNKLAVIVFSIFALSPRGALSDGNGQNGAVSVWSLRSLQYVLVFLYLSSGVCKIAHGDWIRRPEDMLWAFLQGYYLTDAAAWLLTVFPRPVWSALQLSALLFELLAPVLFLIPRVRPLGFVVGIGFHTIIAVTMQRLELFSCQVLAFYVLFVSPRSLAMVRSWRWGAKTVASVPRDGATT